MLGLDGFSAGRLIERALGLGSDELGPHLIALGLGGLAGVAFVLEDKQKAGDGYPNRRPG